MKSKLYLTLHVPKMLVIFTLIKQKCVCVCVCVSLTGTSWLIFVFWYGGMHSRFELWIDIGWLLLGMLPVYIIFINPHTLYIIKCLTLWLEHKTEFLDTPVTQNVMPGLYSLTRVIKSYLSRAENFIIATKKLWVGKFEKVVFPRALWLLQVQSPFIIQRTLEITRFQIIYRCKAGCGRTHLGF